MTRRGQYGCVIAGLVLCLALAIRSVGSLEAVPPRGPAAPEAWLPARLDGVETTLASLGPAAKSYARTGAASERERFEHLLTRLDESSGVLESPLAYVNGRERRQLLEASRSMLASIRSLGREILDVPDVRDTRATAVKVGALTGLVDRTLTAIAELRTIAAPAADATPPTPKPPSKGTTVPEGVAVLLVTIIWTVSTALLSTPRRHNSLRRALTILSRRRTSP